MNRKENIPREEGTTLIIPTRRTTKDVQLQYQWWNPVDKRWEYDYTDELQPHNTYCAKPRIFNTSVKGENFP